MLMSSALFKKGSYDDVVNWVWSLGDISSGGNEFVPGQSVQRCRSSTAQQA